MEVLAIIPARSGSKSVKDKNIRLINSKPMLAYSVEHAQKALSVNRVIISTDSQKYADIASQYGCEVPFLRPGKYATDTSLDFDVFYHALTFLEKNEGYVPDIVVQLRPTYPIRCVEDIDNMVNLLVKHDNADSVRCIVKAKEIPHKMWLKDGEELRPILNDIPEAYNMPRQALPDVYYQNACIDVIRASTILKKRSMTGDVILGYEMSHNYDIDTEEEFLTAAKILELRECTGKKFVIDIDGVIAAFDAELKYECARPMENIIKIINDLYLRGNKITLFTARGYKTGIDWSQVTEKQLSDWGVLYNELIFGKPDADFYIDDKMLSIADLIKIKEI